MKKMELMAPAGNKECFLVALDEGADSIYLGLKKFNARRPAENFTNHELKRALIYAHKKNKKIYVTLNIDLKSNEIDTAAEIVQFLTEIKCDGVIVKDPGLIHLLKTFYQDKIEIHFSTQAAVSSSFGVLAAKHFGAKRVVLARELELEEIEAACAIPGIDIEVFTEGSMCFSISGRCYISSWVGGRSGNRGTCTAPCRISWQTQEKSFPYFSMKDLSLVTELPSLQQAGVSALKIEGRLKNALWVKTIVAIYKKALAENQTKESLEELKMKLSQFSARENGTGHLYTHQGLISKNEKWDNYKKQEISISDSEEVFKEDKYITIIKNEGNLSIKVQINEIEKIIELKLPPEAKKAKVFDCSIFLERLQEQFVDFIIELNTEDLNFTSNYMSKMSDEISALIKKIDQELDKMSPLPENILQFIQGVPLQKKRDKILGTIPDKVILFPHQLDYTHEIIKKVKKVVITLDTNPDSEKLKFLQSQVELILSIPPVLYEKSAQKMQETIIQLHKKGFNQFEANSLTGMEILRSLDCKKYMGLDYPVLNHLAAEFFYSEGFLSCYVSPEGDDSIYKALSSFCTGSIECLVFGKIKLFQSRVNAAYFNSLNTFKDRYVTLECFSQNGINNFVEKTPLGFIGEDFKKLSLRFDSLTADLRYFPDPAAVLRDLEAGKYHTKNTNPFNFFRKLP